MYKSWCRYSHDYELTREQEDALRKQMKSIPCTSIKARGIDPCPNGDDCLYGEPHVLRSSVLLKRSR
jgi:hypothetical protein